MVLSELGFVQVPRLVDLLRNRWPLQCLFVVLQIVGVFQPWEHVVQRVMAKPLARGGFRCRRILRPICSFRHRLISAPGPWHSDVEACVR